MLSFIISIVMFLITLPLKTLQLGYKTALSARDKVIELSERREENDTVARLLKSKVVELKARKSKNNEDSEKRFNIKNIALNTAILALKSTVWVLKAGSILFAILSFFFTSVVSIVAIILIVAVSSSITLFSTDAGKNLISSSGHINYGYNSSWQPGNVTDGYPDVEPDNGYNPSIGGGSSGGGSSWQPSIGTESNSDWVTACEEMWAWYCDNISTYWAGGKSTRGWFYCSLLDGEVGDDCSAFVSACLAHAGYDIGAWSSGYSWASGSFSKYNSKLAQYFDYYTTEDFLTGSYVPQVGDILAYNYSGRGGHVEIIGYLGTSKNGSWSWGSVPSEEVRRTKSPVNRTSDLNIFINYMWRSNIEKGNKVTAIWRAKN